MNRLVNAALTAFVCLPVLGFLLIFGARIQVQIPPETAYAATAALLGMAGGGYRHRRRRRQ
ncbi:hypothetical protein ACFQ2B_01690 [Streptomyces stramineus]|uniref:PEP-CTERM protein-sorting domain-containing protein n=1 Tax=Streptomyces stramineus TaxID=173861 RepID=A0ABN1B619_9ACTN